jgi:cell division protease FtsH
MSTGAEQDLREATRIAKRMVARYGMSEDIGPVYFEHEEEHAFLGQRIANNSGTSDATVYRIESEARLLLREMLARARATIELHRDSLDRLVDALLARETLEHVDLVNLLGEPTTERVAVPVESADWQMHAL